MFISMNEKEMMSVNGGEKWEAKYGDLRDVPSAVGHAFKGLWDTVTKNEAFQDSFVGTMQVTYGVIRQKPIAVMNGWDKIKGAANK